MLKRYFLPRKSKKDGKEKDQAVVKPLDEAVVGKLPKERRFGFWGNLPLARKFLLIFGALSIFAMVIAVVSLSGLSRVQSNYEDTLSQGIEMRSLSNQLTTSLLQARDNERNFIQHWRDEGFDRAYKNYVTAHAQHVADIREDLKQLAAFGPVAATVSTGDITQAQYEADIASLTQNVDKYEQSFTALVEAHRKKGFDDSTDFESQFRTAADRIYVELFFYRQPGAVDQLQINYLKLRSSEYNYLAYEDLQYVVEVHNFVAVLKDQFAASDQFDSPTRTEMITQANTYLKAFDELVVLDGEIAVYNKELIDARGAVEASAAKIETLGKQLAVDGVKTAQSNSARTFAISIVTALVAFAISVLLAITLLRQLTRPIILLTNTAQEISAGKFDVQAQVNSTDEIGTLAQAFNNMTAQLRGALQNLDRRAREAEVARAEAEAARRETESQSWFIRGQAQLAERMRGDPSIDVLANNVTSHLCQYLGAQTGAFFLVSSDKLKLIGRYAFEVNAVRTKEFGFEENLVGEAAKSNRMILVDNIPADAKLISSMPGEAEPRQLLVAPIEVEPNRTVLVDNIPADVPLVSSALGEAMPRQLLIAPIEAEGQVFGVMEFATLDHFSEEHQTFLRRVSESIAIAFRTAQTHARINELLTQSQRQTEELQAQEEELRAANEELHAQAENLRTTRESRR